MKKTSTEGTIETDEIWIIRRPGRGLAARCPECGERTTLFTPDEAALLTELNQREIFRQIDSGLIHGVKMPGGLVLVCSNSIVKLSTDAI